jgi:Ca2+-binding RTX toxin-like protein
MAFDVNAYLAANPDVAMVANNSGWTDAQVIEHYVNFGYDEGRVLTWNTADYLALNPDVAAALASAVNVDQAARAHYQLFGADEGRAYFFDAADYLAANPDLVSAGITTETGALSHYMAYGRFEGRLLGFDAEAYLEMYPDLAAAGITEENALEHYRAFGQAEGRAYDPILDPPSTDNTITATETDLGYMLSLDSEDKTVALTADDLVVDGGDGTDVLRLVGDAAIRIDMTNPASQVEGIDLDSGGLIETNGIENNLTGQDILTVSNFEVVDAYRRDQYDTTVGSNEDNFRGSILFDGTGWDGDGVNTDGNIFLGGISDDTAYGGIGNDFLAGGGFYVDTDGEGANQDSLFGGRNADFFFVEISALDNVDGDSLFIDGGTTFDDDASQDFDWILLEASDDNEPVVVNLGGTIAAGAGAQFAGVTIANTENLDASGNLYGFLNDYDVVLGGEMDYKAAHAADGTENYGLGSTAQMQINGTGGTNIIVGGYDNDTIRGEGGNDVLLGGNMMYLTENQNNPNILDIPNDGIDTIFGDANVNGDATVGADDILYEMDGGIYDGGGVQNTDDLGADTLWLTDYVAGASTVDAMTTDGTVRIDLGVGKQGGTGNYAGYGGADTTASTRNYTADQSNYGFGVSRGQVQDFESVIATGLGDIDYDTDGGNDSEQNFTSQMNFDGVGTVNLDLRGTNGANTLYADAGDDVIEGREGNDSLMGGGGNDDFIFQLGAPSREGAADNMHTSDGIDIIHRQTDADGDGIWDTDFMGFAAYEQDFGLEPETSTGDSSLVLTVLETNNPGNELANITVTEITSVIRDTDGDVEFTLNTPEIRAANTFDELLTAVQDAIAADPTIADTLTATLVGDSIVITDSEGRTLEDQAPDAFFSASANNLDITLEMDFGEAPEVVSEDRLIFASYEDRADGELVDDDGTVNETGDAVSLGRDSYAEDLVVRFDSDGNGTTVIAEDQAWTINFTNMADEDSATVSVNGTAFYLKMGVAADGTAIQENDVQFVTRLADLINAGSDNDTLAGTLVAAANGTSLTLTQGNYNRGQVVFMDRPVVTLTNGSGGEPPSVGWGAMNGADTEITLFEFDGRDNGLNAENVLFLGGSGMNNGVVTDDTKSRSVLATADAEGGDLLGSDALVIDSMLDADTIATDYSLHGHDSLFTGAGDDDVVAGTGDDTIYGSVGDDTVDGGKDLYVVQTMVSGVLVETVEEMNAYDAGQKLAEAGVVNVAALERETTAGLGGANNLFYDTLVFNANDFAGTQFTITADDDLTQENGGAGTVGVDEDDDGTIEHLTTFTEMEAIRTLNGDGTHAGQGHDTLDVQALSDAVAASDAGDPDAGVVYNMTSALGLIQVNADLNGDGVINNATGANGPDEIVNFLAVDGVERLLGGNANETLNIDESEVLKDNYFDGDDEIALAFTPPNTEGDTPDLVGDSIVYNHRDMDNDGVNDDTDADIDTDDDGVLDIYENDNEVDIDGDGVLDLVNEDLNGNGVLDAGEDANGNGLLDFDEDLNNDGLLNGRDFNFDTVAVSMLPSMELVIDDSDTDLVNLTGGTIVGSDTTTDTLVDVETIDITNAAISATLDDTLDVSGINGATVNFIPIALGGGSAPAGTVLDGAVVEAQIIGMNQIENVVGSTGDDLVLVANTMTNYRAYDADDANTAISYDSFLSYDTVENVTGDRQTLSEIAINARPEANNQGLYTFDLGDGDDRVDYSGETGNIAAVVDLTGENDTQTLFVLGDDLDLNDNEDLDNDGVLDAGEDVSGNGLLDTDRIDLLTNVEETVASTGVSILDFTGATEDLELTFQYDDNNRIAALDRMESIIRIADGDGNTIDGVGNYVEYYDLNEDNTVAPFVNATWNQIEGSDYGDTVIYEGSEDLVNDAGLDHRFTNDTLNLRGGSNTVNYSALETSITVVVTVTESDADALVNNALNPDPDVDYTTGSIVAAVTFQDGDGNALVGGGGHTVNSYTSDNDVAAGTLKVEASQDAEDTVTFTSASEKLYILGASAGVLDVKIGDLDAMRLTGFEILQDAASDDVYYFESLLTGLTYVDNIAADTDTISVGNNAIGYNALPAPQNDDIDLGELSNEIGIDFDILDVTRVTAGSVDLVGGSPGVEAETVLLDDLSLFDNISLFEIVALGADTTITGTLEVDVTGLEIYDATNTVTIDANVDTLDFSDMTTGLAVNVTSVASFTVLGGSGVDVITGGAAADFIAGGGGNDVLSAGAVGEVRQIELEGSLTGGGVNTITATFTDPTAATRTYTITEGIDVVAGAGRDAVGNALVDMINADLATLNLALDYGVDIVSVTYEDTTDEITITFEPGLDVDDVLGTIVVADTDAGDSFAASAEDEAVAGSTGGVDIFYGGAGVDTINGGGANDTFVAIGKVLSTDYVLADTVGEAAASFEDAVTAIVDGQAASDTTTDVFNGGDGVDQLETWGTLSLVGATLNSIETLDVHSAVTITAAQLNSLTTVNTQANSVVNITGSVLGADLAKFGVLTNGAIVNFDLDGDGVLGEAGEVITGAGGALAADLLKALAPPTGTAGVDTPVLTANGDLYDGEGGNDVINGLAGNDVIWGGADNDTIDGGAGNDTLYGEAGDDILTGGTGNDYMSGGVGTDTFNVDSGVDTISDFSTGEVLTVGTAATANVTVNGDFIATVATANDNGTVIFTPDNDVNVTLTNATVGDADEDGYTIDASANTADSTLDGSAADDTIFGGAGVDTITGGAGDDTIFGGAGADDITANAGDDTIYGGGGIDTFTFAATGADNGEDTITDATAGGAGDVFDFTLFLTAAAADLNGPYDGTQGAQSIENDVTILEDVAGNEDITTAAGLETALAVGGEYAAIDMAVTETAVILTTATAGGSTGDVYAFYATSDGAGDITVDLVGVINNVDVDDFVAGNFA